MPSVQVKLNPTSEAIPGGAASKHVTGLKVELNLQGKEATLATATPQKAELRFYEVARAGDADLPAPLDKKDQEPGVGSATPKNLGQELAKLAGTLKVDGGKPVFDAAGSMLQYTLPGLRTAPVKKNAGFLPPTTSTDSFLELEWASPSFQNTDHLSNENDRLFLPWRDFASEAGTIDIGCDLTVAGKSEFHFDDKNVVSVPLSHANVPIDGDLVTGTPKDRVEFHGLGVVHPTRNHLFKAHGFKAKQVRFGATPRLKVMLHEGLGVVVKDLNRLGRFVNAAFNDIGIVIDFEARLTDADARSGGFEHKADPFVSGDSTWIAKDDDKGTALPFFTYWVFHVHKVDTTASGLSEALLSVKAAGEKSEKTVRYPIRLIGGKSGADRRGIEHDLEKLDGDEDKDLHVANVIAHEIGHSFGFDHALQAKGGAGYKLQMTSPDFARCVMSWENLGAFAFTRARRFGPVCTAMLRRDFALP